jgi:RNA polymerase sigma-70 factor (ECF subfamily)
VVQDPGHLDQLQPDEQRASLDRQLEAHLPALRAFLRAIAGPRVRQDDDIDDLAQSVCREVLEHADRFQHPGPDAFRRWIFREAHRKVLSRRRALEAVKRGGEPIDPGTRVGALEELIAQYRSFTTPSQGLALAEEVARVEEALDGLPEEQRQVVVLAHLAQWSRRDIAEELDKSEGAVRMLLHRGLAALAVAMATPAD